MFTRLLPLAFLLSSTAADAAIIYNGAANTPPGSQGWAASVGGSASQSVSGGATTLDTTAAMSDQAGYGWVFTPLNRTTGYQVRFDLQLTAETHVSNDRAGLSVIVLSSDLQGIELGFWPGEIWAQSSTPLFTHAEGAAFNPGAALTRFDLTILGTTYALSAGGVPLLSGNLRNYSSFGAPYTTPNFIFVGDDTTSASGAFKFARADVNAVPEPASAALLALGLGGLAARRRRRA